MSRNGERDRSIDAELVRAIENHTEASRVVGRRLASLADEVAELKASLAVRQAAGDRESRTALKKIKGALIKASPWLVGGAIGWLAKHLGVVP